MMLQEPQEAKVNHLLHQLAQTTSHGDRMEVLVLSEDQTQHWGTDLLLIMECLAAAWQGDDGWGWREG